MDTLTKQLLDSIISPNDSVYELFKQKKKSGWFYFWDTMLDVIPSTFTSLKNDKVVYLVASTHKGTIYEIENGKIVNKINIPNWKQTDQYQFKQVVVGEYKYKKYRKLN